MDVVGDVYVADSSVSNATGVLKYTQGGALLAHWSTVGVGDGGFNIVDDEAVSADGNIYVTQGYANRVQLFTNSGSFVSQWGAAGSGNGQFWYPADVAVDRGGNIFVADTGNQRVQKFAHLPTHPHKRTWAGLKSFYRGASTSAPAAPIGR